MSVMFDPDTAIYPFPPKPTPLSIDEKAYYREKIKRLLKERNAVMVAHYYTDPEIQQLAEETGGCISDSLEMARFGAKHPASTLLVAGVRFMGETAKILSPEKTILMPTLQADCSLDLGCPVEEFNAFCDAHPDRTVVVYAKSFPHQRLIVATDRGIFYKMQQAVPDKELLEAPTAGEGATCRSCAHCPWMAMNGLQAIAEALEQEGSNHEVHVDERLRERALVPLNRMQDFAATLRG